MKYIFIFGALLLFSLSIFLPTHVLASNSSNIQLPQDKSVNGDYIAGGETVSVDGTVNGDTYVAGGSVMLGGSFQRDVLAAGGQVTIDGNVADNIRVIGGQVTINGPVGGNVSVAAGHISLGPHAKISGNLVYIGGSTLTKSSGAIVSGKIMQNVPSQQQQNRFAASIPGILVSFFLFSRLASAVGLLVLGTLFILLMPLYTRQTIEIVKDRPWVSLGVGVLVFIVTPILAILLFTTLIGIPLAFLLIALYIIFLSFGKIAMMLWGGLVLLGPREVKGRRAVSPNPVWAFVLGLIIYEIVAFIPFIGGLLSLLATLFGIGALSLAEMRFYKDLRSKRLI